MMRIYPPYGIQGESRRYTPTLRDIAAALWACPGVQLFALLAIAAIAFLIGFVTGANCEATRHSVAGV